MDEIEEDWHEEKIPLEVPRIEPGTSSDYKSVALPLSSTPINIFSKFLKGYTFYKLP